MSTDLRLSILDQSPIAEGSTGSQALADTIDLARLADALGYHRYWVAEHHGGPTLAGPAPEALIGPIASATDGLRVGSGGVMLPHYSPLKVAETFSLLAGLYPGRIDLGIGRAPGTTPTTTLALRRDRRHALADDFPSQLAELLGYLEDDLPDGFPFAHLAAHLPGRPETPTPWMLGSSQQSAIWAAELGLPYAFADFIAPDGAAWTRLYRERFVPSVRSRASRTAVCAWILCAETDEEAQVLAASSRMVFEFLRRGEPIPVPPPEKARRFLADHGETGGRRWILGAPDTVRPQVEALAAEYGAEEVIVVTITYDHLARRRSYELLADVFAIAPRMPRAAVG